MSQTQRAPSALDTFLQHYSRFFASASNQDKGLKLLQWTLWLFAFHYGNNRGSSAKTTTIARGLRKLYNDVTFSRYLLRFYGFPDALLALRTGSWTVGTSVFAKFLGNLMALSMVGYYPLEHVAYVKWMLPPSSSSTQQELGGRSNRSWYTAERLSAYSCRCWVVYLVAEIIQTTLTLKRHYEQQAKKKKEQSSLQDDGSLSTSNCAMVSQQQLQLIRSLLFTLPCISWSLPNWDTQPWLTEGTCNGLMFLESLVSMIQAIRSYRIQHTASC